MANRHLELGVFAPTIGCMPPVADRSFCLISSAEQRTDITFAYNRRVAEILEHAGLEIFFMAQRMGAGFGPSRFWGTALDRLHQAGIDGVLLTFRHVREELEEFIEKVVPRLE